MVNNAEPTLRAHVIIVINDDGGGETKGNNKFCTIKVNYQIHLQRQIGRECDETPSGSSFSVDGYGFSCFTHMAANLVRSEVRHRARCVLSAFDPAFQHVWPSPRALQRSIDGSSTIHQPALFSTKSFDGSSTIHQPALFQRSFDGSQKIHRWIFNDPSTRALLDQELRWIFNNPSTRALSTELRWIHKKIHHPALFQRSFDGSSQRINRKRVRTLSDTRAGHSSASTARIPSTDRHFKLHMATSHSSHAMGRVEWSGAIAMGSMSKCWLQ